MSILNERPVSRKASLPVLTIHEQEVPRSKLSRRPSLSDAFESRKIGDN